jgi:hypothetical protein
MPGIQNLKGISQNIRVRFLCGVANTHRKAIVGIIHIWNGIEIGNAQPKEL